MKKIYILIIVLILKTINIFAFEFDFSLALLGVGFGPSFARGKDYKNILSDNGKYKFTKSISFSEGVDVRAQIDMFKYVGAELGFGYSYKAHGFTYNTTQKDPVTGVDITYKETYGYKFHQLSIPLFFRGQYEFIDMVNVYGGFGPRFLFNVNVRAEEYIEGGLLINETNTYKLRKEEYKVFDMDLSFAIGTEIKFLKRNYAGLRIGYDLNLLGSLTRLNLDKRIRQKFYIDNLSILVTYRFVLLDDWSLGWN